MKKSRIALLTLIPLSVAGGAAAWAGSRGVSSGAIEAYQLNTPSDEKGIEVNRGLFAMDEMDGKLPPKNSNEYARKAMAIYGSPGERPERFLFVDPKLIVRPKECPTVAFLPVTGKAPVEAMTVEFFGDLALQASVVFAAFLLLANLLAFATDPSRGGRSAAAD